MAQTPFFYLFFSWVGLALAWGVLRFPNNIYMFSNPKKLGKSQTRYYFYSNGLHISIRALPGTAAVCTIRLTICVAQYQVQQYQFYTRYHVWHKPAMASTHKLWYCIYVDAHLPVLLYSYVYTSKYIHALHQVPFRDVGDVKSRGWRTLKRDRQVTHSSSHSLRWKKHGAWAALFLKENNSESGGK